MSKLLHGAKNVTEINQIISDQIETQKEIRATELRVVSRKNYFIFKWGSLLFSLSTILFALLTGIYAFYQLPQIERSVDAQAKYIAKDYAGVLTALADVSPSLFSQSIKYIVAVSVIQLDHLTSLEKTAILNQLSQESSENRLLYWIYIDRNNLQQALDIAQNIGDEQYLLHVYTKLYLTVKMNDQMSGEKKQKLLKNYQEKISQYSKKPGENKSENPTK